MLGPEPELLDVAPGPRARLHLRLLVVVLLVALAVGAAWQLDRHARAHESAALASCRIRVRDAAVTSDLLLLTVAHNLRSQLSTARGERRDAVERIMANPARELLRDVAGAARECGAISVLPWHASLRGRRDAVAVYSSALAAKVRRIADDGRDFYRDEPSLRRLRRAADVGLIGGRY